MGNNDIKMGWRSNGKIKRGKGRNAMVVANGESINRKHKRKGERWYLRLRLEPDLPSLQKS